MKKVKVELELGALQEILRAVKEDPTGKWKKCPTSIEVVARGKTFDAASDYAKGDPWTEDTRMSDDEVKDKFRTFSYKMLRSTKIEEIIEKVFELEKLDHVTKLTELLAT